MAAQFPTTRWTLLNLVREGDADARRAALEELLRTYLPVMQAHLVYAKGVKPNESDDLIQEFVRSKVLEKGLIHRAEKGLGRFRGFLAKSLDRFLIDQTRRANAGKRFPKEGECVAFDEQEMPTRTNRRPPDIFDVRWARNVIEQTMKRMRAHCEMLGRDDLWGIFKCRLLDPTMNDSEPLPYDDLVERFGLRSPIQATNLLITAKRMYARVLRTVVSEYAKDEAEVESEIQELREILASCPETSMEWKPDA